MENNKNRESLEWDVKKWKNVIDKAPKEEGLSKWLNEMEGYETSLIHGKRVPKV